MTIDFSVEVGGKWYNFKDKPCFVHTHTAVESLWVVNVERFHYYPKDVRNPNSEPPVVDGKPKEFRFRMDMYPGGSYCQKYKKIDDRKEIDLQFDQLFGRMTEGYAEGQWNNRYRTRTGLIWQPNTPYSLVVCASSIYRMDYDGYAHWLKGWRMLSEWDFRPWTKYAILSTVGSGNIREWINVVKRGSKKKKLDTHLEDGHMPIEGSLMCWSAINRLCLLNSNHFSNIRGMSKELYARSNLSVGNRSRLLTGVDNKYHKYDVKPWRSGIPGTSWIWGMARKAGCVYEEVSTIKDPWNGLEKKRSHYHIVNPRKLFDHILEEDKKQRGDK